MDKKTACQCCLDAGILIDPDTYTFASRNKAVLANTYWANPVVEYLSRDWWIVLNDWEEGVLHVFHVPAHALRSAQLGVRNDTGRLNIQIVCGDAQYRNRGADQVSFLPYFVRTIPCAIGESGVAQQKETGAQTPKNGKVSAFDALLDDVFEDAVESQELSENSANSYKSYLHSLAKEIDAEYGVRWFENLPASYATSDSAEYYRVCTEFISRRLQQAQENEKKLWQQRQSAFRKFSSFLEARYEGLATASPDERQTIAELIPELSEEPLPVTKNIAAKLASPSDSVVESLDKRELMNKFFARLKSQSRWYPAIGEHGVLFPARLLNRIFSSNNDKRWRELLRGDLGMMRIRYGAGEGDVCQFDNISSMEMLADGRFTVTVAGAVHAMHTRTWQGNIVVECSRKGWAGISIDHLVPMENDIRANVDSMPTFQRLTCLVCSFLDEQGEAYDLRYDEGWFRQVYEANRQELDGMRDALYEELCRLDRRYELMDTLENGKRSNRA